MRDRPSWQEDVVAGCWFEVLGERAADAADGAGFLASGGNSLRAARLAGLIRERCGVVVPLHLLLRDNAALPELRRFVEDAPAADDAEDAGLMTPAPTSPLAPEQERLWLLGRLHPDSSAYNVVAPVRLIGELDLAALRRALDLVADAYDVLRAEVAVAASGNPYWVYAQRGALPLEVRAAPGELSASIVDEFTRAVAAEVIPDSVAPLARAVLLRSAREDDACLVLSFNHLIADQATLTVLLGRLGAYYSAACHGREPAAVEPPPSYAAYATRVAGRRGGPEHRRDLEYWSEQLGHLPVELPMPFRRRRPEQPTFHGSAISRPLGAEDSARLELLLREHGRTPMSFFLACIAVVVAAWSGQDDVVLGVPASRRASPAEQRLAGFLLDTLPVCVRVSPESNPHVLAAAVGQRHLDAVAHSTPTFDDIVEHLGIRARPGRNPIFQIWVNDLTEPVEVGEFAGLEAVWHPQPMNAALFDLGWYLWHREGTYELQLVRDTALFAEDVAAELADQVLRVVRQAIADPGLPVSAIGLLGDRAPDLDAELPRATGDDDLVGRIRRMAARRPGATAIVGPDEQLSYGGLVASIDRTAARLAEAGVPAGAVVEVDARRRVTFPVALLGAWAHGARPVLLDGAIPDERRRLCRQLTRPAATLSGVDGGDVAVAPLSSGGDGAAAAGLSHFLLTSGTSGRPLVVRVPRGPLANFTDWYVEEFGLGPDDRFALLAGTGHDPVLRDIVTPLVTGAQLHVPPAGVFEDPALLAGWLADSRVTVVHVTPALLEIMLSGTSRRYEHLRLVVTGGAQLTAGLAGRFHELSDAVLVNAYGTTETPQIAACEIVAGPGKAPPADLPHEAPLPVGRGVAGHQVLVMAPDGSVAAPGQRGEIAVRGHWLAAGYQEAGPEAAHRFRRDPTGVRWFWTGDLGRFDPEGRIVVDGRGDRQVSVDGFRVELDEIERVTLAHPRVRKALAMMRQTPAGAVLSLRVSPVPGGAVSREEIRARLAATLPRYAVPRAIEVVDGMPLTANHKPASMSSLDETVAELVREVVGRPLDQDENFMDAGMTSITLVRFHDRLVRELGLDMPVTTLFTHVTLRTLTGFISSGGDREPPVPVAPNGHGLGDVATSRQALRRRIQRVAYPARETP